ncbi:glycoside hydrolase family 51 protein [Panaeolus papilionaceus]|nr:glycoside hydrolase family 51 protein [Panaeolus papilionaceus]
MLTSRSFFIFLASTLLVYVAPHVAAQKVVTVSSTASHPIPPLLWGQMFEDISSGDGGLYAELLQNRALQMVTPGTPASLAGWTAVNNGNITVVAAPVPVSSALPNAIQLTVPPGAVSGVGFANTGYSDGFKLTAHTTYKASLFYRIASAPSNFKGKLTLALQDSAGTVLDSRTFAISGSQSTWKQIKTTLTPRTTPGSTENKFVVTVDSTPPKGSTTTGEEVIHFAMHSLFPPTFKGRENGMRIDIAEALQSMKPSFFRLPGGNNLEGQSIASRWQWNNTLGDLVDRPGRFGDWGYVNTDGLGLLEYLNWCEDLDMEPIMAVWAGFAVSGISLPENQLPPYIQQAIDQINFVVGDPAKSAAAAWRARLGHPKPFKLTYVEVGNEDFFAATSYVYRWHDFVTALQAEFPEIHFIATSNTFSPVLSPGPTEYDVHVYQTPTWFAQNSFFYDSFERNGTKYFEGEYAAISTNPNNIFGSPADGRLTFPTMQSAAGEAAFMTGLERNSDIVFAASYAPLLGHITNNQWTPNLLAFDAQNVYKSTSFLVQQLFSMNRGDEYLPSTLPDEQGTLFWSVVRNKSPKQVIIKVSNTAGTADSLTFDFGNVKIASSGTVQMLTGPPTESNTKADPTLFVPATNKIPTGSKFNFSAPPFSVSVITVAIL